MKRTRVKICGITSVADALMAASFGCDAIGLVFYKKSPRYVSLETAKAILSALPAFVTTVALFVDPDEQEIKVVLDVLPIDLLQFHGNESENFCSSFSKPYIKAITIPELLVSDISSIEKQQHVLLEKVSQYQSACGFLFDHFDPFKIGGTGKKFDWNCIPESIKKKIILAGGLNADNIEQAILQVSPYALDVSSGVEQFTNEISGETLKGKKDKQRMAAFFAAVNKTNSLI